MAPERAIIWNYVPQDINVKYIFKNYLGFWSLDYKKVNTKHPENHGFLRVSRFI